MTTVIEELNKLPNLIREQANKLGIEIPLREVKGPYMQTCEEVKIR